MLRQDDIRDCTRDLLLVERAKECAGRQAGLNWPGPWQGSSGKKHSGPMKTAIESLKIVLLVHRRRHCLRHPARSGHGKGLRGILHYRPPAHLPHGRPDAACLRLGSHCDVVDGGDSGRSRRACVPARIVAQVRRRSFGSAHRLPADRHGLFIAPGWGIGLLCCQGRWRATGRFPGLPSSSGKARCVLGRSLGTSRGLRGWILRWDRREHLGSVSAAANGDGLPGNRYNMVSQSFPETGGMP